jgi:hypothetical protein
VRRILRVSAIALTLVCGACVSTPRRGTATDASPYLLIFAGDRDAKDDDFFAVVDLRSNSKTFGKVVATTPIGMRASLPHHMEYQLPPAGELLFANAHHHEATFLVDVSNPLKLVIERTLEPPPPFRFGHDFARMPNGHLLLGYLRSEGASPTPGDSLVPGGHGGLAEFSAHGDLIRSASAAVRSSAEPIRTYAIVPMLDIDRIVTTSAPMMEDHVADVVQVWRYSDLTLLHTIQVPDGRRADGSSLAGAARFPFGPRRLRDGSIMLNSYGCGFYRLTNIASDKPTLVNTYTIQVPEPATAGDVRGACSIPVIVGNYWIMPVGRAHTVVVLDISDPAKPKEGSRLDTPADFNPHWLAKDPRSERLVLGAELGGEQGMFILDFNSSTGQLRFDPDIPSPAGKVGYVDLTQQDWPHGSSGPAWGHAALFLSNAH